MDFLDLVKCRYSVRKYRPDPVEKPKLDVILEAARLAPTAVNKQAFRLIVLHPQGQEERLKPIYHPEWFTTAPLIICVCALPAENWIRNGDNRNYSDVDATIVADHIVMAAADQGLGTCWIAAFDPQICRKVLEIPDEADPVILITIGYADDQPGERKRKSLDELVRYDRWS